MQSLETNPFLLPDYLRMGNPRQQELWEDLEKWKILKNLIGFKPTLAGTIPIGIDTKNSDVDILAKFNVPSHLQKICYAKFRNLPNYSFSEKTISLRVTLICRFSTPKFNYEIFAQSIEPTEQYAWIHMMVENRFLNFANQSFRENILHLKESGKKTEHAFCESLGLSGDPFKTLLQWNQKSDDEYKELLSKQGYLNS